MLFASTMVNLLKVLVLPPFGYYAPWVTSKKEDSKESSMRTSSHATVPEQPGQIKVHFLVNVSQPDGLLKAKDMNAYVVPDQAIHGVEYFLHFTHQQFVSNILGQLYKPNRKNGKCLQGAGVTIWSQVLEELNVESKPWLECIQNRTT